MRKFLLLLAVLWRISVYSGDSGRIVFTAQEEPRFIHDGRWVCFKDSHGDEIFLSGSSTIVIRSIVEAK